MGLLYQILGRRGALWAAWAWCRARRREHADKKIEKRTTERAYALTAREHMAAQRAKVTLDIFARLVDAACYRAHFAHNADDVPKDNYPNSASTTTATAVMIKKIFAWRMSFI